MSSHTFIRNSIFSILVLFVQTPHQDSIVSSTSNQQLTIFILCLRVSSDNTSDPTIVSFQHPQICYFVWSWHLYLFVNKIYNLYSVYYKYTYPHWSITIAYHNTIQYTRLITHSSTYYIHHIDIIVHSSKGTLQYGQSLFFFNHGLIHFEWKIWLHLSFLIFFYSSNPWTHIGHSYTFSGLLILSLTL